MGILKRGNGVLAAVAIALAGSVFAAAPALARTNHALLVAVTKYPNLKGADLVGPNNDIRLVRTFLEEDSPAKFEPAHIRVLADGLDGALESPTHDAITGQLTKLAETVAPGDFVYLHFSGHGTQQPAVDVTQEPDGLDEVFLPADTNRWVDRSKGIPSAFADNEIGDAVQAIRDMDDRWIPARRIWNQHTYHVTNVREDGTIPQLEPPSWESLNTFRTQAQVSAGGGVCKPAG